MDQAFFTSGTTGHPTRDHIVATAKTHMRRTIRCDHGFAIGIRDVTCVECEALKAGVPVPPPEPSSAYKRERYERRGNGRAYSCSACGGSGHAKTTCEKLKQERADRARHPNPNLVYRPIPA